MAANDKLTRYYWVGLAEGHLTRRQFGAMLDRIALLPIPRLSSFPSPSCADR